MPFKAFFMALGMFSIFPVRKSWNPACARWVIPMLPLVGLLIGLAWYAVAVCTRGLHLMPRCALVTLAPLALCGFLHADGFMDTADAVFSRRPLEERRRILKDPNAGAFSVIAVCCLLLLQFSFVYAALDSGKALAALVFIPAVSRCAVGFALLVLKPISPSGLMYTFKERTGTVHAVCVAVTAGILLITAHLRGGGRTLAAPVVTLACAAWCAWRLYKQMDGFSGDLCGCCVVVSELAGVAVLACL